MDDHWQGVIKRVPDSDAVGSKLEKHVVCQDREGEKKKKGGGEERNGGREETKAALEKSTYRLDESCQGLKGGL